MSGMNPTIEILPARPLSSSPELVDVVLRITPPTPEDHLPAPVDLALVIDTSGSMGGRPLHLAQEAARQTIRALHPTDRLTLVTFASGATMLTPLLPVADGTHLLRAVDRLRARGNTALHAGWQLGAGLLNSALHLSRLPSVLLVTDGRANVGVINPATIAVDVAQSLGQGVSTSTVGVGTRYDEHLLEHLAEAGDGNYAFAETPEALSASFLSELKALRATVCRMARLSVSGPRITDLLNDLPRLADGRLALPPLRAGRPLDVLLQVSAQAGEQLTLQLDWTGLDGQTRAMEVNHTFAAVLPGQQPQDDPEVVHLRAGLSRRGRSGRWRAPSTTETSTGPSPR